MKTILSLVIITSALLLTSCEGNTPNEETKQSPATISQKVDAAAEKLQAELSTYQMIAILDHHRMAAEEGVYTPPSTAYIFSDSKTEIALVQENQLAGLDAPFKILCYAEADTTEAHVAYTSAAFIQKRHNLDPSLLEGYTSKMTDLLSAFSAEMISETDVTGVEEGFGIVSIPSDYDFSTTIENLKSIIMSQGDTKWFGDIDYQKEAVALGDSLRPTTLLLFGGPAPGGKAMQTSPKIGLDAFCQKLLVYENAEGDVWVAYNDIVAFANLYYQTTTKPQQMINQRLKMTFTKAITAAVEE